VNNEARIHDVLAGDLIGLQGGMEIPGDAVVISANQLEVDESAMTGETLAMKKNNTEFIIKQKQ
jgi:P-type E1-E2 ATPase